MKLNDRFQVISCQISKESLLPFGVLAYFKITRFQFKEITDFNQFSKESLLPFGVLVL